MNRLYLGLILCTLTLGLASFASAENACHELFDSSGESNLSRETESASQASSILRLSFVDLARVLSAESSAVIVKTLVSSKSEDVWNLAYRILLQRKSVVFSKSLKQREEKSLENLIAKSLVSENLDPRQQLLLVSLLVDSKDARILSTVRTTLARLQSDFANSFSHYSTSAENRVGAKRTD